MKIKSISIFKSAIAFAGISYRVSDTKSYAEIDNTVVAVATDRGDIGWGEVAPWGRTYLPEYAEGARAGLAILAPVLIGRDAGDPSAIYRLMDAELSGHGYAKSALDMACWDLLGKMSGLPLYLLLGGRASAKVPLLSAVFNGPFEDMLRRIEQRRDQGYKGFSAKPSGDPPADIDLYKRLAAHRRPGEIYIADANRLWPFPAATQVVEEIEGLGFILEQPCDRYEECLRIRHRSGMLFVLDELVTDFDMLTRIVRDNAADVIHLKISRVGGISKARVFRDFCVAAGLQIIWATSGGTEINDAAVAHLACSTPPENLVGMWSCREFSASRFAAGGPALAEGFAIPTDLPGLGIALDLASLGKPIAAFD